ncbi:rhodanese family protein [Pseudoxanthomonas daejeonensis]|uniref:rhodanese family protein n=1 Tax=Pseudoxanthomonas daejeonensis TaxID=266062 RepID=UPI001F5408B3|nr:rhodanese family protein [Pseudoxanthomonas daejeonensis]UNK58842.1 rhodanese family protein [Pseudoxanthomonas daejeonensis]
MQTVSPREARALLDQGALLVDIREVDEHAREHIDGACCVPLARLADAPALHGASGIVLFHCRSGMRTRANAGALQAATAGCTAYVVDGGIDAWKRAGLPVTHDARAPLELMRQVQIAAGSLVLLGTVLATMVSPWFLLLSGFVGAGLVFAGISGFCGMALLLARMPWNRAIR